jgi:hypothetical protein
MLHGNVLEIGSGYPSPGLSATLSHKGRGTLLLSNLGGTTQCDSYWLF